MNPAPANTLPNSLSGMLAMSESMVAMKDDAEVSACSSGSHRLSEVMGDCLDGDAVRCCCCCIVRPTAGGANA